MADVRTSDVYLDVEHAMTEDERGAFLAQWTALNPAWVGATVADVLAELANADALLRQVEPAYEVYGDKVPEPGLLGAAVRVVAYLYPSKGMPQTSWALVLDLIRRVRALR